MLKKKRFSAGDYVVAKLVTGDEVFGRLVSQSDSELVLHNPMTADFGVALYMNPTLYSFVELTSDEETSIRMNAVIAINKLRDDLVESYTSALDKN